jgi:hypothetical protein
MAAVPVVAPVTIPVADTGAIAVFELLHTPPVVASFKFEVNPRQMPVLPAILAGTGFTVTGSVVIQPLPDV